MAISDLKIGAFHEWLRLEARATAPPTPVRASQPLGRRAAALLAKVFLLAVLPFFVLVRTSVALYSDQRYLTWVAIAAGVGGMLVVVTAYAAWFSLRLTGRARILPVARGVALPLVVAYCCYALLYLSAANAKSERVHAYYTSLHPLLRIAVSTLILFDREIVITDVARRPQDYATLGLPVNDGSLHQLQRDGYAHAADLRTVGRRALKNRLVQLYFWSMGFETRRHVGTADHLHVELPRR